MYLRAGASVVFALTSVSILRESEVSSLLVWFPLVFLAYVLALLVLAAPRFHPQTLRLNGTGVILSTAVWVALWLRNDSDEVGVVGALLEGVVADVLPAVLAVLVVLAEREVIPRDESVKRAGE